MARQADSSRLLQIGILGTARIARLFVESAQTYSFLAESESCRDLLEHGWERWTGATPEESTDIMLTLEALAASARRGGAVVEVAS